MGNTLLPEYFLGREITADQRDRNTRTFIRNFIINNQDLRDMGFANDLSRHFVSKPKIKKTKIKGQDCYIKTDTVEFKEKKILSFILRFKGEVTMNLYVNSSIDLRMKNPSLSEIRKTKQQEIKLETLSGFKEEEITFDLSLYINTTNLERNIYIGLETINTKRIEYIYKLCIDKKAETVNNSLIYVSTKDKVFKMKDIYNVHNETMSISHSSKTDKRIAIPTCSICMFEKINTLILPCRHFACCFPCSNVLRNNDNKCPICRKVVLEIVKLYFK